MKTKLLCLFSLIIGLSFYSCSSDDADAPVTPQEGKMQTVSFELPEFASSLSVRNTSPSYSINYLVYQKGGNNDKDLLKSKLFNQDQITSIKDTLPMGEYYITIFATDSKKSEDNIGLGVLTMNYQKAELLLKNYKSDVLFKTFTLTVGSNAVQQKVVLERIVSKVDIIVEDALDIPADVVEVMVHTGRSTPNLFLFESESTHGSDYNTVFARYTRDQVLAGALDSMSFNVFQTEKLFIPGSGGLDVIISLLKPGNGLPAGAMLSSDRVIKRNAIIGANKVLRLSGKLFENNATSNIEMNTEWGAVTSEGFGSW